MLEMHRVLKPTGSLYLHIDHTAHAYAKAMMDAIFGRKQFRNEIVWWYKNASRGKKQFARAHDIILWYNKSGGYIFNRNDVLVPFESGMTEWRYQHGGQTGKEMPAGKTPDDVILMPSLNTMDKERTGYPTQKPLALYERIVKASSNEGDLVLDPFAGCATTCVAAERLGREWIAIDINSAAEDVVRDRLQNEVRLPMGIRSWRRAVHVRTTPPRRTDGGAKAAPELTLVSAQPKAPRLTARELRRRLILDDGLKCQGCGWVPPHEEYMEVDHRLPKSLGGPDALRNRVLLCPPCNGAKGKKLTLAELRLKRIEEGRTMDKRWDMAWYEREGRFG